MAAKKYPGDTDGVEKLTQKITGGSGPQVQGVTVSGLSSLNYHIVIALL